jgi:protein TonB
LLATILVHLLLLLFFLLSHAPQIVKKVKDDELVTFSMMPQAERKNAGEKTKAKSRMADKAAAAPHPKPAEAAPPAVAPKPKDETPSFIQLSPSDFAAGDVGKIPSRGAANGSGGSTGSSRAVAGPGMGPGGMQLYAAEWYRHPTPAELRPYLPADLLEKFPDKVVVDLACKTIENFHVENCQVLGEDPPGSGLGRGIRQASWQFLIRPPRIDGKPMIGTYVFIHWTETITRSAAGGNDQ